jgi:hypothetical protein
MSKITRTKTISFPFQQNSDKDDNIICLSSIVLLFAFDTYKSVFPKSSYYLNLDFP